MNYFTKYTSKYIPIKYQDRNVLNRDTSVTHVDVINILIEHFKNQVEHLLAKELAETELPDRNAGAIRTNQTKQDMLNKSLFPRSVLRTTYNVMQEPLVSIPTMEKINSLANAMRTNLFTIIHKNPISQPIDPLDERPLEEIPVNQTFNFWKDIHLSVYGKPKYATYNLSYSILLSNRQEADDLAKLLKMFYPAGELVGVYQKYQDGFINKARLDIAKKDYTEGKITLEEYYKLMLHSTKYADKGIHSHHELKVKLPEILINMLKDTFTTTSDEDLYNILESQSINPIIYDINGATREYNFSTKIRSPIFLQLENIDAGEYVKDGNTSLFVVRMEFLLHYFDIISFTPSASYQILNNNNILNYNNPDVPDVNTWMTGYYFQMGAKTVYETYWLEYEKEDYDANLDQTSVLIEDVILDEEMLDYINTYRVENYNTGKESSPNNFPYYDIQVKRDVYDFKNDVTANDISTDPFITVDYLNLKIVDYKGKENQKIYIILMINKPLYNKFRIEKGYSKPRNLSTKF